MNRWTVLLVTLALAGCAATGGPAPRVRSVDDGGPDRFHRPVIVQVGWQRYWEQSITPVTHGEWAASRADSLRAGSMPVLVFHYLDDDERITLPMNIDNALLGRLLKSTAITEIPIETPVEGYLEKADCANCHPADVAME